MQLGYHASHEQFSPAEMLRLVQLAEQAGFTGIMSADHFNPWSARQGESGFTWTPDDGRPVASLIALR